jgi:hypothetical protein
MRGFIFYRGKSPIDNRPIVGIAVLKSRNEKTGNMVQTFILRSDIHPMDAIKSADDVSICGSCIHRGDSKTKRTCYVDVGKSVSQIYKAFRRGSYPDMSRDLSHAAAQLKGRKVRLGAYGDPAMIPADTWLALLSEASDWTGYTHQWKQAFAMAHRELCMASADSIEDRDLARAMGWRTFRVIAINATPKLDREIYCPASPEGGNRRQCINCTACDGALKPSAVSIAIVAHGKSAAHYQ